VNRRKWFILIEYNRSLWPDSDVVGAVAIPAAVLHERMSKIAIAAVPQPLSSDRIAACAKETRTREQ